MAAVQWGGAVLASTLALASASAVAADGVAAAPPAAFEAVVEQVVARYGLPGIAVGVIREGQVVHTHASGERIAGSGLPVTPHTQFKIASNTKAMTAALLARLVVAGKLRWDDPVARHLPGFALHDPWATREIRVGDLLVHNSGLPEGGGDLMLWPEPNHFTRADILRGLRHIPPAYGFRAGYAYDNLLYVVAGEVAAAAGGDSYEALLRREVFEPLGLRGCRVGAFGARGLELAQPHARAGGRNVVVGGDGELVPAITSAAAGGVRCSLADMLAWAANWLAPTQAQLAWLPAAQRAELWKPRTPMPVGARARAWDNTHVRLYAYGFRLADVDGAWTVSHTGTLSGMYSAMVLLPDQRSGFVLMINGDADDARTVLTRALTGLLLAPTRSPDVAGLADALAREHAGDRASSAPGATAVRVAVRAGDAAVIAGRWEDPWFGGAQVCDDGDGLVFAAGKSPLLRGRVMREGGQLLVDWFDPGVDVEARLWRDDDGLLRMAKRDPDADFSYDFEHLAFKRTGDCPAR